MDKAIFDYCSTGDIEFLESLILSLGKAESFLTKRKTLQEKLNPINIPNFEWLKLIEQNKFLNRDFNSDSYREFEIAQALASIVGEKGEHSIRENLESVEFKNNNFVWSSDSTSAIWSAGDLAENLSNVLQRRSIDARKNSLPHPPLQAKRYASLDAVAAFLNGETDDERLEDYLFALSLINWRSDNRTAPPTSRQTQNLPRIYALFKLLFLPKGELKRENAATIEIKHEPSIIPLLRAGRIADALEVAGRRLRSSGIAPLTSDFYYPENEGSRLAAALLIPIDQKAVEEIASLVLPNSEKSND